MKKIVDDLINFINTTNDNQILETLQKDVLNYTIGLNIKLYKNKLKELLKKNNIEFESVAIKKTKDSLQQVEKISVVVKNKRDLIVVSSVIDIFIKQYKLKVEKISIEY